MPKSIWASSLWKAFHNEDYGKWGAMFSTTAGTEPPCFWPARSLHNSHRDSSHLSRSGAIFRERRVARDGVPACCSAFRFASGSVWT